MSNGLLRQSQPRVLAVIPARGGSKGLPNKNVRTLGGLPLVARTIRAAKEAPSVSVVAVSSDNNHILEIAARYGAMPVLRPAELATDTASSELAILHALSFAEEAAGARFDYVVFLQCTSPFTTGKEVEGLIQALRDNPDCECALLVSPNHGFLWRRSASGAGVGINHNHLEQRKRRQDLEPEFRENGAGYAMRATTFNSVKSRFCGPVALVETQLPFIEIDDLHDFVLAEAILAHDKSQSVAPALQNIRALVTDFDGVHTDDYVYVGQDGQEQVRCSRKDGLGIDLLTRSGVSVLILSREQNAVVSARAKKLKCAVIQGVGDKLEVLNKWANEHMLTWDQIAYLGNDLNDLECMTQCAVSFAPSDAALAAKAAASVVLDTAGGQGVVREVCDIILSAQHGAPKER
jgi:YrbI family 3-deoxy-D-manno-octulosonate 8-phosphate phosphatase